MILFFLSRILLIFAALLAHELGHLTGAAIFGIPVRKIGFCWMGAYIQRGRGEGWKEVVVCLLGPTVNLLLALLFWNVSQWFMLLNLTLGIVNLLPIANSDGTHAIEAMSTEEVK